jgi:hypothetical protein
MSVQKPSHILYNPITKKLEKPPRPKQKIIKMKRLRKQKSDRVIIDAFP